MGCYRAKHTHDMDKSVRGFSDSHTSSHFSRRGSRVPVQRGHLWTGLHTWAPQGLMRGSRRPPVGAPAGQLHARQSPQTGSLRGAGPSVGSMAISLRGYSRPEKGETRQHGEDARAVSVLHPQKQGHQMLLVPSASQKTSSTQPPHPSMGDPSLGPEGQAEREEDNLPPPQSKKHPSQVKKLPKIPSNTEVLPKPAVKTDCKSSVSAHTKDTSPGRAGQGAPAPPVLLAGSRPPHLASKIQKNPQAPLSLK